MTYPRPLQWYHSQATLIWTDGTFEIEKNSSVTE